MKNLLLITMLLTSNLFAQYEVKHIPSDYLDYNTTVKDSFKSEFQYDCYLETAKEISFLADEYILYCESNPIAIEAYEIIYWDGTKFDTAYSETQAIIPESEIRPIILHYKETPNFEGFFEWLKIFIKSYE